MKVIERLAAPGARIVDLGCGGGALLRLLRRHGRPDWSLVGWDFPGPHMDRLADASVLLVSDHTKGHTDTMRNGTWTLTIPTASSSITFPGTFKGGTP